jgi:hypothetical protein
MTPPTEIDTFERLQPIISKNVGVFEASCLTKFDKLREDVFTSENEEQAVLTDVQQVFCITIDEAEWQAACTVGDLTQLVILKISQKP